MQLEVGMLREPRFDLRRFVGAVVVDDEMQVEMLFDGAVDAPHETDELFGAVARQAFADNETGLHGESSLLTVALTDVVTIYRVAG